MRNTLIILLAMSGAVAATAGPLLSKQEQAKVLERKSPPSSGMLRTMPHGAYECALPGDAGGKAYRVVAEEGFRISTASRYSVNGDTGTYILRGDKLTFTAGPKNGERFDRVGENQLRRTDINGNRGNLLCTRLADRRQ
jgi:hypothetical protein